jgi:gliding-associated putative ABC transporter substrate-binding component GldG
MLLQFLKTRFGWIYILLAIILLNLMVSYARFRIDLTAEHRFTIAEPTKKIVSSLNEPVEITVLLSGELPVGFKKLAQTVSSMLDEFSIISNHNIIYHFENPGNITDDSTKMLLLDSLRALGINPTNVKAQIKEGEGQSQQLVYPGAIIRFKNRTIGVDFLQGQNFADGMQSLNKAEALVEYKLANGIRKIVQDTVPIIGYLLGNGEPFDQRINDLITNTLRPNYGFRFINIDSVPFIPNGFNALLVVKPLKRFTEPQKLKLDQYAIHGGKLIWMIDKLYASLDSLQRSEGQFIAFDLDLNLDDLFFKYGIRINQDLVQSLQCDRIPSVIGSMGDKPQMQLLPWPYFPLLSNTNGHPMAKNLDYIIAHFPNSIDTVQAVGIKKTILLSSAPESRTLSTPAKVEWASIRNEEDLRTFNKPNIPVAALLEGRFKSLYANRISMQELDAFNAVGYRFLPESSTDNKMIVIANGDLPLNAVTQKEGPLPMGMNMFTQQQFANREFILNALEYLTDPSGILETRSKDFSLRLMDKSKYENSKLYWQLLNILFPVVLVILFIAGFQFLRNQKYGSPKG